MRQLALVLTIAVGLPLGALGAIGPGTPAPSTTPLARFSAAADAECADVAVVVAPGAGEGSGTSAGETLEPVLRGIVDGAGTRTIETRFAYAAAPGPLALRGRGDGRTPADEAVTRAAWKAWRAPASSMRTLVRDAVDLTVTTCPEQLLVLLGYAQGAEAVHRYLSGDVPADVQSRTVAGVLVADPARVAGSGGTLTGDPAAPRAARGVSAKLDRTPYPAVPRTGWLPPLHSVCTAGDIACDLTATKFRRAIRIHREYDDRAGLRAGLGRDIGDRVTLFPKPAVGQTAQARVGLLSKDRLRVEIADRARSSLRWTPTSTLPDGMRLTERGVLTGTPREAGRFAVTYKVRNTSSPSLARPMAGSLALSVAEEIRSEVSSGGRHTCEIRPDGTLWCWGANFYGQLGTGDTAGSSIPRQVGARDDWREVSAGGMHTCAVRESGSLWCWGLNYRGQLGLGSRADKAQPRRVGDARDWASVSSGWVHTCATRKDGSAWCWGDNDHGQLGTGGRTDRWEPVRVDRGGSWREVTAGGWHTCGVAGDGSAFCWGRNLTGQIGDGTVERRTSPARVGSGGDWLTVLPAWTHTCGLRVGGFLDCWGNDEADQLGNGEKGGTRAPTRIGGDRQWSALDVGAGFTCALDTGQELWCWGAGRQGQLGSVGRRSDTPAPAFPGQTFAAVDLGWLHACGLASDRMLSCWGNNETGELGDGSTTSRRTNLGVTRPEAGDAAEDSAEIEREGVGPVPGARSMPPARRAGASGGPFSFVLSSFNTLGSNHTAPRSDAGEYSPARIRTEWMIDYLDRIDASVVGFQEIQRDQVSWFTRAAPAYSVWPGTSDGSQGLQTSIAWRNGTWRLLETDLVPIPFITQTRHMPLVQLEHLKTGRRIWVMNVHNAPRDYQQQREVALDREIRRLKDIPGKDPVFLVGDFNERHRAFCEVTGRTSLVAPRGGSHDGSCNPPSGFVRIDWIFGSRTVDYSGYAEDKSPLAQLITDHAVLRVKVSVP